MSTLREPLVNRKDLRAVTLVGPPRDNQEPDPLAAIHLDNQLDNRLYISAKIKNIKATKKVFKNVILRSHLIAI